MHVLYMYSVWLLIIFCFYINNHNVCSNVLMQEAKDLWKKIQERQGVNKWRPDLEEEYEDREGNIYNKKTYADLQRQGLI